MKVRKEGRKLGPTESTAPLPAARVEAPGPPRLRGVAVPLAAAARRCRAPSGRRVSPALRSAPLRSGRQPRLVVRCPWSRYCSAVHGVIGARCSGRWPCSPGDWIQRCRTPPLRLGLLEAAGACLEWAVSYLGAPNPTSVAIPCAGQAVKKASSVSIAVSFCKESTLYPDFLFFILFIFQREYCESEQFSCCFFNTSSEAPLGRPESLGRAPYNRLSLLLSCLCLLSGFM